MSKNGRNRHKGKGAGGTGRPGTRSSTPQSLSTFRAERAVDALTPAFVRWFEEGSPGSAAAALDCLTPIKAVMARYMEGTPAADVTSLEPGGLAVAVEAEILATVDAIGALAGATAVEESVREITGFVVDTVRAFIEFLVETGRWSGSADQLAEVIEHFTATATATDDDGGGWGLVDVPDVPDQQALEAFSGLPLIRRVTALLQWIGEGKPVTSTGAVRQRDIEAAAASVGVVVRGGTKRAGSPLPGTGSPADHVPTVRSMYDVPLLALLWTTLETAELIEITATKVVPTADAGDFLAGGPSDRLAELVFIVDQYLTAAVLDWNPAQPWERMISGLQVSILLAAATADPPEKARVLATAEHAPEAERAMAGLLTGVVMRRLDELAELGLLTIDTHFRVPRALIRCIANVFDDDRVLAGLGLGEAPEDAGLEPVCAVRGGSRAGSCGGTGGRHAGPAAEDHAQRFEAADLAACPGSGRHAAPSAAPGDPGPVRLARLSPARVPDRGIPGPQVCAAEPGRGRFLR